MLLVFGVHRPSGTSPCNSNLSVKSNRSCPLPDVSSRACEAALADYENKMFPRSHKAAEAAHRTIEFVFGANAPAGVISLFAGDEDPSS